MSKNVEISYRIREFIENKFSGNSAEAARALSMKPQALQTYLNGKSIPGGLLLIRFFKLGCDINWLLNGVNNSINVVQEKTQLYGDMNYVQLTKELENLQHKIDQLKIENYDLREERDNYTKENAKLRKEIDGLQEEIKKLSRE